MVFDANVDSALACVVNQRKRNGVEMIGKMKMNWLVGIVAGPIALGLGIVLLVKKLVLDGNIVISFSRSSAYPGLDLLMLTSGMIMMLLVAYLIFPSIKSCHNSFKKIYIGEFIIILFVAIFGFLVPFATALLGNPFYLVNIGHAGGAQGLSFWYGLVFCIHGVIKLAECAFSKPSKKALVFVIGIVLVAVGVYLIFNGVRLVSIIELVIAWVIALVGLLLTVAAVWGMSKHKK